MLGSAHHDKQLDLGRSESEGGGWKVKCVFVQKVGTSEYLNQPNELKERNLFLLPLNDKIDKSIKRKEEKIDSRWNKMSRLRKRKHFWIG